MKTSVNRNSLITLVLISMALMTALIAVGSEANDELEKRSRKEAPAKMRGIVIDQYGIAVEDAAVELYEDGILIYRTSTTKKGRFELKFDDQTNVRVDVYKNGFEPGLTDCQRAEDEYTGEVIGYLLEYRLRKLKPEECIGQRGIVRSVISLK